MRLCQQQHSTQQLGTAITEPTCKSHVYTNKDVTKQRVVVVNLKATILIKAVITRTLLVLISTEAQLEVFPHSALLDGSINAQLLQGMCKWAVHAPQAALLVKVVLAPFASVVFWKDTL